MRASPLNPLFVFIDESGNFDFSEKGTRHFVMAAVITDDPLKSAIPLQSLRYKLLADGIDLPHFHASKDKQRVRNLVFEAICMSEPRHGFVIVAEKEAVPKDQQNKVAIYALFGIEMAKLIASFIEDSICDQVILVFDGALTGQDVDTFHAYMTPTLRTLALPFRILFQSVNLDYNGQMADYLAWSYFVSFERNELRPVNSLPEVLKNETRLFAPIK